MPAFEGSDGTLLTESNAIAYYVANEELRGGAGAAARAEVRFEVLKRKLLHIFKIRDDQEDPDPLIFLSAGPSIFFIGSYH